MDVIKEALVQDGHSAHTHFLAFKVSILLHQEEEGELKWTLY